jgi:hypothetical protein
MTQIDRVDWQRLSSEVATATPADAPAGLLDFLGAGAAIGAAVGLLAGVAIGAAVARRAARRR